MDEVLYREKNLLRDAVAAYNVEGISKQALYHNTLLLLKLYSKVNWRITNEIEELNEICVELVDQQLNEVLNTTLGLDPRINTERLRNRLESIEQSKSIIDFINQSLTTLKKHPENGEKYYALINLCYIKKSDKPIEDLAEELDMSRATLFREKKKAINEVGVILWGYFFQ